eukprot:CAMPEP_0113505690 /NCGR_PEP_ID=MMETSP0014_2-20120614/35467_1 /TAXON_ID=2857 /ORGANISM="Nitzschia sp." /LENGTH=553 /DNA_ID=CAMNT_0000401051 /DNA_START=71 /DNA_END=1733 /DNA_ORIENTATION=- /assembly_acc=CAM_ASM_000159
MSNTATTKSSSSSSSSSQPLQPSSARGIPSKALCWVVNLLSCLSVFLFSGIIYGWAPLYLILVGEGQYSQVCTNTNDLDDNTGSVDDVTTTTSTSTSTSCPAQDLHLGKIFTLGQFLLNFASLPVGFLLDHTSKSYFTASVELSTLLGYYSSHIQTRSQIMIFSYALLALSGSMTMLGAFPTTFLLPKYQAALLAAISCLFDASSITFFGFYELVLYVGSDNVTIIRQRLFVGWAILSFVIFACLVVLWMYLDRFDWKELDLSSSVTDDDINQKKEVSVGIGDGDNGHENGDDTEMDIGELTELSHLLHGANESFSNSFGSPHQRIPTSSTSTSFRRMDDLLSQSDRKRRRSSRIQELQTKSLRQMLSTFHFGVAAIFTSISMLRINFYILTVDTFLLSLGDVDARYAEAFSWILPSGLLFVPVIDWTANRLGVINTLRVTNVIGIVFGAILLVPILAVQGSNFLLLTCYRAFVYAVISVFVAQTFGVDAMGRMFGSCAFVAALVSLAQSPMAAMTQSGFDGDFYPMNCFNLVLAMVPVIAVEAYHRWEDDSE